MKVFWKVLAVIFSIVVCSGLVIFTVVGGGFSLESFIKIFNENPFEVALASLGYGGLFFILIFGQLNDLINYYCD